MLNWRQDIAHFSGNITSLISITESVFPVLLSSLHYPSTPTINVVLEALHMVLGFSYIIGA